MNTGLYNDRGLHVELAAGCLSVLYYPTARNNCCSTKRSTILHLCFCLQRFPYLAVWKNLRITKLPKCRRIPACCCCPYYYDHRHVLFLKISEPKSFIGRQFWLKSNSKAQSILWQFSNSTVFPPGSLAKCEHLVFYIDNHKYIQVFYLLVFRLENIFKLLEMFLNFLLAYSWKCWSKKYVDNL